MHQRLRSLVASIEHRSSYESLLAQRVSTGLPSRSTFVRGCGVVTQKAQQTARSLLLIQSRARDITYEFLEPEEKASFKSLTRDKKPKTTVGGQKRKAAKQIPFDASDGSQLLSESPLRRRRAHVLPLSGRTPIIKTTAPLARVINYPSVLDQLALLERFEATEAATVPNCSTTATAPEHSTMDQDKGLTMHPRAATRFEPADCRPMSAKELSKYKPRLCVHRRHVRGGA